METKGKEKMKATKENDNAYGGKDFSWLSIRKQWKTMKFSLKCLKEENVTPESYHSEYIIQERR